jgi:hypothetical protein
MAALESYQKAKVVSPVPSQNLEFKQAGRHSDLVKREHKAFLHICLLVS